MATKKAVEVKSLVDLQKELVEKRKELADARYSHTAGELVNPRVLRELRRSIARLQTAINNNKEVQ
jgi:ribosomal protein L29